LVIDICSSLIVYYKIGDGLGLGLEDRGLGLGFVLAVSGLGLGW